jgi:sugar phosphate isomerase/epimerase
MHRVLCSTGAITGEPNGYDYKLLGELSKRLTCDGFELMMDSPWYREIEELKSYLLSARLNIPVVHCEKSIGEMISIGGDENLEKAMQWFEMDCDVARYVGAGKLVLHLWGGRASDSDFGKNIAAYLRLLGIAQRYGLDLLIENVVCNRENPMKHLCELKEKYPEIHFIFDTKMAAFHQQLDLLYEEKYDWLWKEGHICHYHVNDYAGGYMDWSNLRTLPIGKGNVDFGKFFAFIKKTGYKGDFTVEATAFDNAGIVNVEMLNEQFGRIWESLGSFGDEA